MAGEQQGTRQRAQGGGGAQARAWVQGGSRLLWPPPAHLLDLAACPLLYLPHTCFSESRDSR